MPIQNLYDYDRGKAIGYANHWAMSRNPMYYDYSNIGGDCTNFISQCIHEGAGIMDRTHTFGWYYINSNDKAPSWTGVPYLYNYLTRSTNTPGPVGREVSASEVEPGDIIQLAFQESGNFGHSLFIVKCGSPAAINNILINTHTDDRKDYSLTNFFWSRIRFVKIIGVRR